MLAQTPFSMGTSSTSTWRIPWPDWPCNPSSRFWIRSGVSFLVYEPEIPPSFLLVVWALHHVPEVHGNTSIAGSRRSVVAVFLLLSPEVVWALHHVLDNLRFTHISVACIHDLWLLVHGNTSITGSQTPVRDPKGHIFQLQWFLVIQLL